MGDVGLVKLSVTAKADNEVDAGHIVALPLGGRIKLNPWDDSLELLKSKPEGTVAEREKMPFEITPFMIYLTRVASDAPKTSEFISSPSGN